MPIVNPTVVVPDGRAWFVKKKSGVITRKLNGSCGWCQRSWHNGVIVFN